MVNFFKHFGKKMHESQKASTSASPTINIAIFRHFENFLLFFKQKFEKHLVCHTKTVFTIFDFFYQFLFVDLNWIRTNH